MSRESDVQIVVLDGFTLNPGDLEWAILESLGACRIYDRTDPSLVVERIADATIVLTNKVIISREVMDACPNIQYVGVLATGYNVVDLDAAREKQITVTNVPGYSTESVAQIVFAHLLNHTHQVSKHACSVRAGDWAKSEDFCYWLNPLVELDGLKLGLVGLGKIGQAVARIANAFGMDVLVYKPRVPETPVSGVSFVSQDTLFQESDVISLHCPLTPETKYLINSDSLNLMKSSAFLINTGRGDLVDEIALSQALQQRQIAGAGLDVASTEPLSHGHPLSKLDNCYFTPHMGWASLAARRRLLSIVCKNIKAFSDGNPENVVS